MSSKYWHLYQLCYVTIFSTNQYRNLLLLDDPGRVRSQITSVVCQIQRFDFECILVVSRKVIIRIPPVLGTKPLYSYSLDRDLGIVQHNASQGIAYPRIFLEDNPQIQKGEARPIWKVKFRSKSTH